MSEETSEDLAALLDIDQLRLDRECVRQPSLYFKYATKLADAKLALDEADTQISELRATLGKKVRANPSNYGLDKITEAALHEVVTSREVYKAAEQDRQKAKHRVDVFGAFVTALEHRKRSLSLLVDLHGQNYFSSPTNGKTSETLATAQREIGRRKREDKKGDR